MISIQVNGQPQTVGAGSTLADLLETMSLTERRVAVEHNLEIIPRSQHAEATLQAGDTVEIVHAIGGG